MSVSVCSEWFSLTQSFQGNIVFMSDFNDKMLRPHKMETSPKFRYFTGVIYIPFPPAQLHTVIPSILPEELWDQKSRSLSNIPVGIYYMPCLQLMGSSFNL